MRQIILILILIMFTITPPICGKEIRLSSGMSESDTIKLLRNVAKNITSSLDVADPNGNFCWELQDYDLYIWLYTTKEDKISRLGFWTIKDFNLGKEERYDLEKMARIIILDSEKQTYKTEAFPRYFPAESMEQREDWYAGDFLIAMKEPILSAIGKDKDYFVFRMLYLPTRPSSSHEPAVVRFEKKGDDFFRYSVTLPGRGEKMPVKGNVQKTIKIPWKEIEQLITSLEKAGYWKLPIIEERSVLAYRPGEIRSNSKDNSDLIIEVIKDGKHRVLHRSSPFYETEKRGLSALVELYRQCAGTTTFDNTRDEGPNPDMRE